METGVHNSYKNSHLPDMVNRHRFVNNYNSIVMQCNPMYVHNLGLRAGAVYKSKTAYTINHTFG